MPQVSVLMPCFNAADTLEAALHSIATQSLDDFEVIAVDDGSTDKSLEILTTWERKDRRLNIVARDHQGIIPSLNAGVEVCTAGYIARMDSDDIAHPERLAMQTAMLDGDGDLAVVSCLVRAFPEDAVRQGFQIYLEWLNALVSDEEIKKEIFIESPFPHPSVMLRKSWLQKVGNYIDRGWPEDYDLWLRLYLAGAKFGKVAEYLLEWREHPQRLTRVDSRYSLENFIRAKAYYLSKGPLIGKDAVFIWGAGMMGRRISKHLLRLNAPLKVFIDVDPKKIGRTRRGFPIISPDDLPAWWGREQSAVILSAVGARGARALIRRKLNKFGLIEGIDWWGIA